MCKCVSVCVTRLCVMPVETGRHDSTWGWRCRRLVVISPAEVLGSEFMACRRAVPTPSYSFILSALPWILEALCAIFFDK